MKLYDVKMTKEEVNRRKREMSHWNAVAKQLYSLTDQAEILKMLVVEIFGLNRLYIVRRIYSHYNNVRRKRELDHIAEFTKYIRITKVREATDEDYDEVPKEEGQ